MALPIVALLAPSLGLPRTLALAAGLGTVVAVLLAAVAFIACAATGCVG